MKLADYFHSGVVEPLGYSPTSASIKPVHIANGLCRAALGEAYDPTLLNHALNRWAKRRSEERHPNADLAAAAPQRLGDLAAPLNSARLGELRELLRDLLGADGAVFDGNANCSYTLTHRTHVTLDHNDRGTGRFLYHLLTTDLGEGESLALPLLRELLADDSDELTVAALPLVDQVAGVPVERADAPASLRTKDAGGGRRTFRSPTARALRSGFDNLAALARGGSKLLSLRRVATFATFAVFLHLSNRSLEFEDGRKFRGRRAPLVLDLVQNGRSPIGTVSHASYNLAGKSIDRLIFHGVSSALAEEHGERWTTRRAEDLIKAVGLRGPAAVQARKRQLLAEAFRSYARGHPLVEALPLAMVDALAEDLSGTPHDFARALGVRGGLLAPRGQRATRKRFAPSPEFVEVLLLAVVAEREEIDSQELADRWFERFGVVVGARSDDAEELTRWSIFSADGDDLAENAAALRDRLLAIGYARRYADGVTLVRVDGGA